MRLSVSEKGFNYFELRSGSHGHVETRVWVNQNLISSRHEETRNILLPGDENPVARPIVISEVAFPCQGLITRTEKGSMVLRPDDKGLCYYVEIPSGYRGSASINRVEGGEVVASGGTYHSGQGSLGVTAWALINAPEGGAITVHGTRSGRRVAVNDVAFRLTPDGKREDLAEDGLEEELT